MDSKQNQQFGKLCDKNMGNYQILVLFKTLIDLVIKINIILVLCKHYIKISYFKHSLNFITPQLTHVFYRN
mgnify:CR=1 FL=1